MSDEFRFEFWRGDKRLLTGEIEGCVVTCNAKDGSRRWYAWTRTWEGPTRPEYMAARADLRDYFEKGGWN